MKHSKQRLVLISFTELCIGFAFGLILPFPMPPGSQKWITGIGLFLVASLLVLWVLERVRHARSVAVLLEEVALQKAAAAEAAADANRVHREIPATLSHDLRTSLNTILGFSSLLLRDSGLTQQQKRHVDMINRSGEQLLALMNGILEKPIPRDAAVERPQEAPAHVARDVQKLRQGSSPCRVLVADDREENRVLLAQMLGRVGFDVCDAANGAETLDQFELWQPDLILMDMRMPVMDGCEATRQIRATPGGDKIKIICLSGNTSEEARDEALAAGANGYLNKPFRDTDLFAAIQAQLAVEYVYKERVSSMHPGDAGVEESISEECMRRLPRELLTQMRDAVVAADFYHMLELIAAIPPQEASLAKGLRQLAERFDSKRLLQLIPPSPKENT